GSTKPVAPTTPTTPATTNSTPDFVADVEVKNFGVTVGKGNVYVRPTLDAIKSGTGVSRGTFRDINGDLSNPRQPYGYWEEFNGPETPGIAGAGPQRVIVGNGGEIWYSPDHYDSFIRLLW